MIYCDGGVIAIFGGLGVGGVFIIPRYVIIYVMVRLSSHVMPSHYCLAFLFGESNER